MYKDSIKNICNTFITLLLVAVVSLPVVALIQEATKVALPITLKQTETDKLSTAYVAYINKRKELDAIFQLILTTKLNTQNALEEKGNAQIINKEVIETATNFNTILTTVRQEYKCLDCEPSPDFKQLNRKAVAK